MNTLNAIEEALAVAERLASESGSEEDQATVDAGRAAIEALATDPWDRDGSDYDGWFQRYFRSDYLSEEGFEALRNMLDRLALELGGIDEDGDRRVQVIALQRNQHNFMHFQPEPQATMGRMSESDLLHHWRVVSMNHGIVADQMRRLDFEMRETLGGEGE